MHPCFQIMSRHVLVSNSETVPGRNKWRKPSESVEPFHSQFMSVYQVEVEISRFEFYTKLFPCCASVNLGCNNAIILGNSIAFHTQKKTSKIKYSVISSHSTHLLYIHKATDTGMSLLLVRMIT